MLFTEGKHQAFERMMRQTPRNHSYSSHSMKKKSEQHDSEGVRLPMKDSETYGKQTVKKMTTDSEPG